MRGIAALLIFFSILPSISVAQTDETKSLFQAVPFNQWVTEGPKEELPWRTWVSSPELSLHQRMLVRFEVQLEGREVLKRCCDGRAVALLEIIDFRGQSFRNYAVENIRQARADLSQAVVVLSWDVFLLPGDYQVAMALYYSGQAGHSLLLKKLAVSPPKNDPLPEAWRGLSTVEFCDPQPEGLDEFLLPRIEGQLNLPVNNQRPIRVEIFENLTPYTAELRTPLWYHERLRVYLPILKSLAQLKMRNGSLNLATMDFARSRLTFEQRDIPDGHLDLTRLKDSLAGNATSRVDVHDIRKPDHYGKFFAQEISERLDMASRTNVSQVNRPLHVLIIVSGDMALGAAPIAPRPNGDALVFYLRCDFAPVGVFHGPVNSNLPYAWQISSLKAEQLDDGIGKALKNLKPHSYTVNSAESVRKAMAAIISELSRM
ncbi:MAG TPA: hypothetical protein VKD70_03345 [Candidatus Acidoferrum sp.]|nr:hypothetical protein [Candidatus Acidoferrum sp.]